jgi:hypothetical protein
MKITLKRTEEQVELVKAMASKNRDVAYEAQVALAEFIGPVLAEVVNQAPTLSNLFTKFSFNEDDNASIPLDLYYDITDEDYLTVWSQQVAGGLPSNAATPVQSEMKFTTYRLDSAIDFDKRYASRSRLDVVSKTFTRLAQEILLKQDRNSAALVFGALAGNGKSDNVASTRGNGHVIGANSAGRLILDDFNRLMTRAKRINQSWAGGTPVGEGNRGVTDLIVSPEVVQSLREMAYNPIGTRDPDGSAISNSSATPIAATDSMRNDVYAGAGIPEFYGVSIMELQEMGKGQRYNKIFAGFTPDVEGPGTSGGTAASANHVVDFSDSTHEIVLGLDRSRDVMLRAVATDAETGSEFSLAADDQYSVRQNKIGYYGSVEEGRMILDNRVLMGICL